MELAGYFRGSLRGPVALQIGGGREYGYGRLFSRTETNGLKAGGFLWRPRAALKRRSSTGCAGCVVAGASKLLTAEGAEKIVEDAEKHRERGSWAGAKTRAFDRQGR